MRQMWSRCYYLGYIMQLARSAMIKFHMFICFIYMEAVYLKNMQICITLNLKDQSKIECQKVVVFNWAFLFIFYFKPYRLELT